MTNLVRNQCVNMKKTNTDTEQSNTSSSGSAETGLVTNIHEGAKLKDFEKVYFVKGQYHYYHYLCDGVNDKGWGCGYRTLQTICSWMTMNYENAPNVPNITTIQKILVQMEDKPESFIGSKQWIGSFEICLVLDQLYNISCKILHVMSGDELSSIASTLVSHFERFGSPVMMGGNIDCSSKAVVGIDMSGAQPRLLIVDPHYVGKARSKEYLHNEGWVRWQPLKEFLSSSFYNLCLPQAIAAD